MTITFGSKKCHRTGSFANDGTGTCDWVSFYRHIAVLSHVNDKLQESKTMQVTTVFHSSVTARALTLGNRIVFKQQR